MTAKAEAVVEAAPAVVVAPEAAVTVAVVAPEAALAVATETPESLSQRKSGDVCGLMCFRLPSQLKSLWRASV